MCSNTEPVRRGRSDSVTSTTSISSVFSSRSSSSSSRPKIYHCDYEGCEKVYSRPSLLTQHQRVHSDARPFQCELCDRAFFRDSHLKAHLLSHSQEKPFKCSTCGKGVNTQQHLKRHEITHTKSFKCDHEGCEESFYKHQQLRHHIQSIHLKTLTCKECDKTFPRPYRLANHMEKHHGASPAYQCTFPGCFNNFKTWSALQLHVKTDHPKLSCNICGKGCVGEEGLRMHMMIHDSETSIKRWKCTECPLDFLKKDELFNHCINDHQFIPAGLKNLFKDEINDPITPPERVQSPLASSAKIQNFISGKNSSVDLLLGTVAKPEKTISCTIKSCSRMFKKDYDLQRHLIWHEKQKERYIKVLNAINDGKEQEQEQQ
ncbi:Zinc finger protein [Wickerhamomyces ciferrii]|uniref:Transcription factor IIIA n=1 Tax=Wickerhamomyces ciferrii (strain ATCC 14091 / BCRC 22168 / CBS 111 / JCM 3599 / NBRC 0793 / NRRL Y-1031 F-60-10) TaxID=1206466 RepID=K0KTX4_WICCF|nr:Zinc finger protein [Wickerhamomyces ciferrii]CCH45472.1 Zinc finger protein [Wickerhamomyces ciferrii]